MHKVNGNAYSSYMFKRIKLTATEILAEFFFHEDRATDRYIVLNNKILDLSVDDFYRQLETPCIKIVLAAFFESCEPQSINLFKQ